METINYGYQADKDIYHAWNGEHFLFSLDSCLRIAELECPDAFRDSLDKPVVDLLVSLPANAATLKAGGVSVLFVSLYRPFNAQDPRYVQFIEAGGLLICHKRFCNANGEELPSIVLNNPYAAMAAFRRLGKYMKSVYVVPTISITGSIGKSTATALLCGIFKKRFKVFSTSGNRNISSFFTKDMYKSYGLPYDFHIQETGGGAPRVVEVSAEMLNSDAYCITTVRPVHINAYKTLSGIMHDKVSFDRVASKTNKMDLFGVVNIDEDIIRDYSYEHRIVTCGITHTEADYVAHSIRQNGRWLELVVDHAGKSAELKVNMPGLHNAYNVLIAYAMAAEWGFSDSEIQEGLFAFPKENKDPRRQNLTEIAGRLIYLDCFNVSFDSILSCMETLNNIEVREGARRIAILNGAKALGAELYSENFETGLKLGRYHVDKFIIVGASTDAPRELVSEEGDSHALYEGVLRSARNASVSYCTSAADAARELIEFSRPGDVILFKGVTAKPMHTFLTSIADIAFGSYYSSSVPNLPKKRFKTEDYKGFYISDIGGINLSEFVNKSSYKQELLTVPTLIDKKPVFRLGKRLYSNMGFSEVDTGLSVQNIGDEAFYGCKRLKKLTLPLNVIYLSQEAFASCTDLEEAIMQGVEHIESGAFRGCSNLRRVELPECCATIEDDAFEGCPNLTIKAKPRTYAERWAKQHGIPLL